MTLIHPLAETAFEALLCYAAATVAAEVLMNLPTIQAALCGRLGRDR